MSDILDLVFKEQAETLPTEPQLTIEEARTQLLLQAHNSLSSTLDIEELRKDSTLGAAALSLWGEGLLASSKDKPGILQISSTGRRLAEELQP